MCIAWHIENTQEMIIVIGFYKAYSLRHNLGHGEKFKALLGEILAFQDFC